MGTVISMSRHDSIDPIQKSLRAQRAVNSAWLGDIRQSKIQRIGFGFLNLILIALGLCNLFFTLVPKPDLFSILVLVPLWSIFAVVGAMGLRKVLRGRSLKVNMRYRSNTEEK